MEDPIHVLILAGAVFLVFASPAILGLILVIADRDG